MASHTDHLNQAAALISSILTNAQQAPSPAGRSNFHSVDGEIATLFRQANSTDNGSRPQPSSNRHRVRQNFSSWAAGSRRRRPTSVEYHDSFNKDVILLPDPTWEFVCKQRSKHFLHENGHILSAFEFHKSWNQSTVFQQIRDEFKPRIPDDVSLQFLMACGNKLVKPKLKEGQELDGHMLHKVFRSKALYVKPSVAILRYNSDTDDQSSAVQEGPSTRSKSRANQLIEEGGAVMLDDTATPSLPLNCDLQTTISPPHTNNSSSSSLLPNQNASVDPVTSVTMMTSSVTVSSSTSVPTSDYSSYVTLMRDFSDLSSDDEDLNRAIVASLETEQAQATQMHNASAKEILSELAEKISTNIRCKFNINRSAVLDGAFRGFNRATYNPNATMNIKFSDDLGRNEEAVDLGGPRREFLRLLMEALIMSSMFEGSAYSQNLALDIAAHREDRYFLAGRAVAVSLVHGGPPPTFLSTTLFDCLAAGSHTTKPVMEDIADTDIYNQVKRVSQCSTFEDLIAATQPMQDYLANAGCLRPLRKIEDKEQLVRDIIMFQVVHRVEAPFQRFQEGLKTLGVLEKLQKNPDSFRPLFCHQQSGLTAEIMDDLFTIHLSSPGSNKRRAEEVVVPFWRDYLIDVEDEEGPSKLEIILAFATGATVIPPIGFIPTPSIGFLHEEEYGDSAVSNLPIANTCINCLKLPLHSSYSVFKDKMDFAFANTHGFGRA
ncbi:uncharacterized protein LOC124850943 isoform X1 [Scophthalmus maximus]|uniref:uncharacterized protein LOC124850943 isoform X1 n=1 Tax=Scophthalmus maximus TaxID=52904 RepID=UPI001FA8B391|nr:uncharacterized protein LOC124850943 isoform X1 [Scophthalmus maximus]